MICFVCKKKLNLIEQSIGNCKCGNMYCNKHRKITNNEKELDSGKFHLCQYDYKIQQQTYIKINNPCVRTPQLLDI